MMSDHLAGMNEKLTQQKDEIDDLKAQLVNTKSSTSKVKQGRVGGGGGGGEQCHGFHRLPETILLTHL